MHNAPTSHPEMSGGSGDEPYLSVRDQNKLIAMLGKAGRRFDLHDSVRQYMIRKSAKIARSENPKHANRAIANLIKMAELDQKDEHHAQDLILTRQVQLHLHRHADSGVQIYIPANGRDVPAEVVVGNLPPEERQIRPEAIAAGVRAQFDADADNGPLSAGDDVPVTDRVKKPKPPVVHF